MGARTMTDDATADAYRRGFAAGKRVGLAEGVEIARDLMAKSMAALEREVLITAGVVGKVETMDEGESGQ